MKKKIFLLNVFLIAFSGILLTSCSKDDDDVIVDVYPGYIEVSFYDSQGNDLLNPKCEKNIIGENIVLEYGNEEYSVLWNRYPTIPSSRFHMAQFYGIWYFDKFTDFPDEEKLYSLTIGEFFRTHDYDTIMKLKYKDKEYEIRYIFKYKCLGKSETKIYLDGKLCKDYIIKIVI